MEDGISMEVNGKWIPAIPLGFMCEVDGCNNTEDLQDYHRNPDDCDGSSWDSEPIMLCKKHGVNHIKIDIIA